MHPYENTHFLGRCSLEYLKLQGEKTHGALTPSTGRKGPQDVWGAQVKNTNKGNLLYAVRGSMQKVGGLKHCQIHIFNCFPNFKSLNF